MIKTDSPSSLKSVHDVGEFALIERFRQIIERLSSSSQPSEMVLGIGDDAAIWRPSQGKDLLFTCDVQMAGKHFFHPESHDKQRAADVGYRCAAVNLSDLAAMAAEPVFALVSLGIPPDLSLAWIEEFYESLVSTFIAYGAQIIGGNITSTEGSFFCDITLAGRTSHDHWLARSNAQIGDRIGLIGYAGRSAAALQLLLDASSLSIHNLTSAERQTLFDAYLHPIPRIREALALAPYINAAIDISDGLLSDLHHILEASQKGAILQQNSLLDDPLLTKFCQNSSQNIENFIFSPSDDYSLLFTAPPQYISTIENLFPPPSIHWIGEITEEKGLFLVTPKNKRPLPKKGWTHF